MEDNFRLSVHTLNYSGTGTSTRVVVRDTNTGEVACSLIVEKLVPPMEQKGIIWEMTKDDQTCYTIWDFTTRREYRRKGLATAALDYAVKLFGNFNLTLIAKPLARYKDDIPLYLLVKFYEKFGFETVKTLTDRVIMKRIHNDV